MAESVMEHNQSLIHECFLLGFSMCMNTQWLSSLFFNEKKQLGKSRAAFL